MRTLRAVFAIVATVGLLIPLSSTSYFAAIPSDEPFVSRLGRYDEQTHKAVQEVLRAKGYYTGPIDGRFGPQSRRALMKFRADHRILLTGNDNLKLDDALAERLFGLQNVGIEHWSDQMCLLAKLGRLSEEDAQGACRGN